jgi:hypothetical protein
MGLLKLRINFMNSSKLTIIIPEMLQAKNLITKSTLSPVTENLKGI